MPSIGGVLPDIAAEIFNQMVDYLPEAGILNHMVADRSTTLDAVFHALAHPARRTMLRRLASGDRNIGELAAPFRMSFPAVSKHVRVLERAKLVRRRIAGRSHICSIDAAPLKKIAEWAEGYRQFWEARFQSLDDILVQLQRKENKHGRGK